MRNFHHRLVPNLLAFLRISKVSQMIALISPLENEYIFFFHALPNLYALIHIFTYLILEPFQRELLRMCFYLLCCICHAALFKLFNGMAQAICRWFHKVNTGFTIYHGIQYTAMTVCNHRCATGLGFYRGDAEVFFSTKYKRFCSAIIIGNLFIT